MADINNEKPYYTKRSHRKSKLGCSACKKRKVKCDEARPTCRACRLRKEQCVYPQTRTPGAAAQEPHGDDQRAALVVSRASSRSSSPPGLVEEPLFVAADRDGVDMKLMWFYTTKAYESFAVDNGNANNPRDTILKVTIPQHAFQTPFLMNCVLGLAALHMDSLHVNDAVARSRAIAYRARTFEGYRKAIEEGNPETFPALIACSLLLCAVSSQSFRDPDVKPLYIVDWMVVWKGIGLIVELVRPKALMESGLATLFYRPPVNLDAAAAHIPGNLLFMITSIADGDEDYPLVQHYYDTLRYLGTLYQEMVAGFGPIMELRIITFFTFLPMEFVEAAKRKRPRALIIIAYYLAFIKLVGHVWWMEGIGDNDIRGICKHLGDAWQSELSVPRAAIGLTDRRAIARVLLGNPDWENPTDGHLEEAAPTLPQLALIDRFGNDYTLAGSFVFRHPDKSQSPPGGADDVALTPSSGTGTTATLDLDFPYLASVADTDVLDIPEDDD